MRVWRWFPHIICAINKRDLQNNPHLPELPRQIRSWLESEDTWLTAKGAENAEEKICIIVYAGSPIADFVVSAQSNDWTSKRGGIGAFLGILIFFLLENTTYQPVNDGECVGQGYHKGTQQIVPQEPFYPDDTLIIHS